ncbi:MAG: adenylate cyclase, class 2 [Microgenomates group bacterium Gr01-1014_5]|nr:MAG: adenylate cyclase, class 2 [Microgenomates group bacterium Gr01-1014_5]
MFFVLCPALLYFLHAMKKANKSARNFEIEFRSVFDKAEYDRLKQFLDKNAENLGEDDKDVHFFIFPDKLLKVTSNTSQGTAKITLKLNRIGKGSAFEEIEFPVQQSEVGRAVEIFTKLKVTDNIMHSFQKRNNYLYNGVELALKFSEHWQYHLELELVVDDENKKSEAENKIREVAKELDIRLLTEEELAELVNNIESEQRNKNE